MKILLFGSTGLLGTHLMREFLLRDWEVYGLRREDINLFDLSQVNNFVGPWLCHHHDGIVVYAAGLTDIHACEINPGNSQHLNVIAPYLLANLCGRVGARFVYFSTDQVFASQTRPMTGFYLHHENDSLYGTFKTTQAYGAAKAKAEQLLRFEQHSLIIRTSWLFGEHPKRTNFVRDVIVRATKGEPINGLHDYVACPSYAPDVARACARVIADPDANGTYHLVNGPAISRFEMAKVVLAHAGLESDVQLFSQDQMGTDWIRRNPSGGLNNTRGPKLRPWTEGLDEYLKILLPSLEGLPAR